MRCRRNCTKLEKIHEARQSLREHGIIRSADMIQLAMLSIWHGQKSVPRVTIPQYLGVNPRLWPKRSRNRNQPPFTCYDKHVFVSTSALLV